MVIKSHWMKLPHPINVIYYLLKAPRLPSLMASVYFVRYGFCSAVGCFSFFCLSLTGLVDSKACAQRAGAGIVIQYLVTGSQWLRWISYGQTYKFFYVKHNCQFFFFFDGNWGQKHNCKLRIKANAVRKVQNETFSQNWTCFFRKVDHVHNWKFDLTLVTKLNFQHYICKYLLIL